MKCVPTTSPSSAPSIRARGVPGACAKAEYPEDTDRSREQQDRRRDMRVSHSVSVSLRRSGRRFSISYSASPKGRASWRRRSLRLAQVCEPQLVRAVTMHRVDDFVASRQVHGNHEIMLERADQPVHRLCAAMNVNRRQFRPLLWRRVPQKEDTRSVAGPGQRCHTAVGFGRERLAAALYVRRRQLRDPAIPRQ